MSNRRGFIKSTSIASLGLISMNQSLYPFDGFSSSKIKISLMPGTVGINVNANELLDLAIKNNFNSIYPMINELKQMSDLEYIEYENTLPSTEENSSPFTNNININQNDTELKNIDLTEKQEKMSNQ